MRLVVDANIVFGALIKRSFMLDLLVLLKEREHDLLSPAYLFEEINGNKERIIGFSKMSEAELNFLFGFLAKRLTVVPKGAYETFLKEAKDLLPGHPWDSPYLALALRFSCPLWWDEKLLKKQPKVEVLPTKELIERLGI